MKIEALINELAALPAPRDAVNMYAAPNADPGNAVRRANLALALQLAVAHGPDLLLIGEAPGYHGARRTGVPFTSERVLLDGVAPLGLFGRERGFGLATADGRISVEQTATIVYRELAGLGLVAAGWNAYPLHPHQPGNEQSNRTPRSSEIALGRPLLQRFLDLFPGVPVLAMGNVAAKALQALNVPHTKLRHPAQGGASQFAAGLRAVAATLRIDHRATDDPSG